MKKILAVLMCIVILFSASLVVNAEELKTFTTYELKTSEIEKWNMFLSQSSPDLNVLANCYDGLLTNDNHGNLVTNAAKSYESPDGGKTWIFTLNEGMTWFTADGTVQADVLASDWATSLEWILNYAKNDSYNTSMPIEMIAGASEYYNYTKDLTAEQGSEAAYALTAEEGSVFSEMVGIQIDDEAGTITYTLVDYLPYFPSVATYGCLYPLSAAMIEEMGVEGYRDILFEDLWYNGPYVVTYFEYQNQKVLSKSPNYWNDANVKRFDQIIIKMVESQSIAFQMLEQGELDYVKLDQATLLEIYKDPENKYYSNLVEARPRKYSYQIHFTFSKNLDDGVTPDTNWNLAVANENFRKSIYYGLDLMNYFARYNSINPLSCQNFGYTMFGVSFTSDGTDYHDLVMDAMGIEESKETYVRYNPELAAEYKAKAIEELTAQGVTFPVQMDYYIAGSSDVAAQTATVLKSIFSEGLGDDYVVLNIKTYISSYAKEVRESKKASFSVNGWGADFGDPINFLGQETYNDDNAWYAVAYSLVNEITDPELIAIYEEFTDMVNEAKAITDDIDARLAGFVEAEVYFLDHALAIPLYYDVSWELTKINNYSKIYTMYGMQGARYIGWEGSTELLTTEEMEAFAAAYNAE